MQSSTARIHDGAFESVKSELKKYYNTYNKTIKPTEYMTDYIQRYVYTRVHPHLCLLHTLCSAIFEPLLWKNWELVAELPKVTATSLLKHSKSLGESMICFAHGNLKGYQVLHELFLNLSTNSKLHVLHLYGT